MVYFSPHALFLLAQSQLQIAHMTSYQLDKPSYFLFQDSAFEVSCKPVKEQ